MIIAYWSGWGALPERSLLLVLGILVFQPMLLLPDLWFQVRLQSRVAVLAQWGAAAASAGIRLVLVFSDAGLAAFAWATIFELSLAGVLLARCAWTRGFRMKWTDRVMAEACRLGREAWPLLLSGIAVAIYMRIDTVMLRHISGERETGIYIAGVKFSEVWLFAPGALAASLLPSIARARVADKVGYAHKLRQYCEVSALLGYALAVPTCLAAPLLVRFAYGQNFIEAVPVQMAHAWILVFACLGVARGQVCVLEGWTRFHLAATIVGAVLNVLLNWILIPLQGPLGAALATVAAQAVAAWISGFCYRPTRELAWMQTKALLAPFPFSRHEG
jgi:polysaccharide transporter, PST family